MVPGSGSRAATRRGGLCSALVDADKAAAGQLLALQGMAQILGRGTGGQSQRRRGGEYPEEVPVRTVTDRRHGAAVALLAEVVAALNGRGRALALSQSGRGRLDVGEHPVGERATGGVGILAEDGQFHSFLRHPGPLQSRGQIVVVLGVAGRDRLVVAEGGAAQLDAGHRQCSNSPSAAGSMNSSNVTPLPSSRRCLQASRHALPPRRPPKTTTATPTWALTNVAPRRPACQSISRSRCATTLL